LHFQGLAVDENTNKNNFWSKSEKTGDFTMPAEHGGKKTISIRNRNNNLSF